MRDLGGSNPRHLQSFTGEAGARPRSRLMRGRLSNGGVGVTRPGRLLSAT
jgi:hypothetical protein